MDQLDLLGQNIPHMEPSPILPTTGQPSLTSSNSIRPGLRHGVYIEKEGYLPKKSSVFRSGPIFHNRRKVRYLVIRGSNLKCLRRPDEETAEWELPLQNAQVTGRIDRLEIEIRAWDTVEEFQADDLTQYTDWFTALKAASDKVIKDYYAFVRTLGEGHFGMVLLAKDRRTRDKFAVKVIKKQHAEMRSMTLIQRELAILRMVYHPNIVRLYDLFDTEDKLYFVLEYMQGGALYQVLSEDETHFSEARASLIVKDILQGLVYLHAKGIVHRDVKPENILTTASKWPFTSKLADFGLSNFLGNADQLVSKVGTPYFCAREVVTNESYGTKADLWSLGVVAYEMLSGRKPFEGSHTKSVLYAILDGRWGFPEPEWTHISDEAKNFIAMLICIDVEKRLSAEQALQHPWIVNEGLHAPIPKRMNSAGLQRANSVPSNVQSDEVMEEDHDDDDELEDDEDDDNVMS